MMDSPPFKPFRDPALVKPVIKVAIDALKEHEFPLKPEDSPVDIITRLRAARCLAYEAGLDKAVAELDAYLKLATEY
jgi:hypothetical protein